MLSPASLTLTWITQSYLLYFWSAAGLGQSHGTWRIHLLRTSNGNRYWVWQTGAMHPRWFVQILEWIHTSKFACHTGRGRTFTLIKRHFCWETLDRYIREYVATCTVCARNKSRNQRPAGLLQPLPKPNGPWSHITLDFVTGLLVSAGKTVILTIADRFSKIPHSLLGQVEHIFQLHGIPAEVVSDRGPQFSSQVWKAFCTTLRAKPCLRSDYHQQTNG